MAPSPSLTPESVGLNSAAITGTRTAVLTISEFSQANLSLVPEVTGMPSWYATVQAAIDAAQTQSKTWLNTICPSVTFGLPIEINAFSKTFATESANILSVLKDVGGGKPTKAQRDSVTASLSKLQSQAKGFAVKAAGVQQQLQAYNAALLSDVEALGAQVGTLEGHLADGSQYVQTLQKIYSEKFVDVNSHLSPCNVIVLLDMNISVKVSMSGAPMQAIAIVMAQTLVSRISDNVKATQPALQVVLDSWGTLEAKLAAVISDLNSASTDFASFLAAFDLAAAQTQWTDLGDFVAQFIPGGSS